MNRGQDNEEWKNQREIQVIQYQDFIEVVIDVDGKCNFRALG